MIHYIFNYKISNRHIINIAFAQSIWFVHKVLCRYEIRNKVQNVMTALFEIRIEGKFLKNRYLLQTYFR